MPLPRLRRYQTTTAKSGEILTTHILPKGGYVYLSTIDRYRIVAACEGGIISREQVEERYHMSPREYAVCAGASPLPPLRFQRRLGSFAIGNDLRIDYSRRTVTHKSHQLSISKQPFDVLEVVIGYQGLVVTPEMIMNYLYPDGYEVLPKLVDVLMNRIRKIIFDQNGISNRILNCRGRGFYWVA